jgi:hypothetical protein
VKITVDLDELKQLVQDSGQIFLRPDGEQALLRLLELQETINGAVDQARRTLEEEALRLNPNFTCIKADNLTVHYRCFGPRYELDEQLLPELNPDLIINRSSCSVNTKAVEAILKTTGELPLGIIERERPRRITFARQEADDDGQE